MKNGSDSLTNGVSKTEHEHQKVYTVNVKKYLSTGQDNLLPPLKPGDTVVVEATTFNTIKQVLDFYSKNRHSWTALFLGNALIQSFMLSLFIN